MTNKDLNKIAAIEKAIAEKYGDEAVVNPRATWDEYKEKEYKRQVKDFYLKQKTLESTTERVNIKGIQVSKKLLSRESKKNCSTCLSVPQVAMDDVCMVKYDCCYSCYEKYIEGREERWAAGWRPNLEKNKKS